MVVSERGCDSEEEMNMDLRKGPWTAEEDTLLNNYITIHGEGRWNSLARCAGGYANHVWCSSLSLSINKDVQFPIFWL